jgi:2-aminoadipate transaminase
MPALTSPLLQLADVRLSEYGQSCARPSPVSQLMQEFSRGFRVGVDVNLGVGYVNEDTIPGEAIAAAFNYVATHPEQYPHAYNYGESKGSQRLESALRRFFLRHELGGYTRATLEQREFAIGANGATSLLFAFAQVMPRGVVITSDPQYYIYSDMLRRLGFSLRTVAEDDDGIDLDALETLLEGCGDEVSFVYIVTVGNPSAAILSNERRERLTRAVTRLSRRLGRKVPLLLDEAYEWLIHDAAHDSAATRGAQYLSGALWDELGLVYELGTLSKVLAPSLRIGFVLGPAGVLLDALIQCTNDIGFSAPLLNQEACAYLLDTVVDDHVRSVRDGYATKGKLVKAALDRELSAWLEHCVGGRAGFYYYLTLKGIETHSASPFYAHCSRTTGELATAELPRIIYLPGNLCVDQSVDADGSKSPAAVRSARQMRLSFGFASSTELERGITLLGEAARAAKDAQAKISESVLANLPLTEFLMHVLASYERVAGAPLVQGSTPPELVQRMARAPFVLLSHNTEAEPVYTFGNALALQLWEMTWLEFTSMQSNRCAERMHRDQREQFLKEVRERGIARGYSGVRISKTGQRFRIEDVTCWNVTNEHGERIGQAACYPRWTFL